MTPKCVVARAGSRNAESASTLEDNHAALCWQALRTTATGQPGSTPRKIMPIRQPLEMPGRYCFHSTRPVPWKRLSVASSVDRQSKSRVNFRRTRRRCFRVWFPSSGKAWAGRPDRAIRHPLPSKALHTGWRRLPCVMQRSGFRLFVSQLSGDLLDHELSPVERDCVTGALAL
jgi:hypothetical protein